MSDEMIMCNFVTLNARGKHSELPLVISSVFGFLFFFQINKVIVALTFGALLIYAGIFLARRKSDNVVALVMLLFRFLCH